MLTIVLAGHANLAAAMKESTELIFGTLETIHTVAFNPEDGYDGLLDKLEAKLAEIGAIADQTLFITDVFGGTPYNVASTLVLKGKGADCLAGMSLPMCLEIAQRRKKSDVGSVVQAVMTNCHMYTKALSLELKNQPDEEEDF